MKFPIHQKQHKIPQVYLKQFGYLHKEQYKVSVLKIGEKFARQKSIESFLAEINLFDIDSANPEIERIFELFNGQLETEFPNIISDLEKDGKLSEKSISVLLHLISNLITRSDYWRSFVYEMLNSDLRENFLKITCAHLADSFEDLEQKDFYRLMVDNPVDEIINRALLFFTDYLLQRIGHFEIVILQAQEGKPWFTSDNPVVLKNHTDKFEFMAKDSEIYFPINPKYLAYLHFEGAADKNNGLRILDSNAIHIVSDQQNWDLQQMILENADGFVIFSDQVKTKFDKREN